MKNCLLQIEEAINYKKACGYIDALNIWILHENYLFRYSLQEENTEKMIKLPLAYARLRLRGSNLFWFNEKLYIASEVQPCLAEIDLTTMSYNEIVYSEINEREEENMFVPRCLDNEIILIPIFGNNLIKISSDHTIKRYEKWREQISGVKKMCAYEWQQNNEGYVAIADLNDTSSILFFERNMKLKRTAIMRKGIYRGLLCSEDGIWVNELNNNRIIEFDRDCNCTIREWDLPEVQDAFIYIKKYNDTIGIISENGWLGTIDLDSGKLENFFKSNYRPLYTDCYSSSGKVLLFDVMENKVVLYTLKEQRSCLEINIKLRSSLGRFIDELAD